MSTTITSKRYAQAVFQIAEQHSQLEKWLEDLKLIASLMENEEFSQLVENPKLPFDAKVEVAKQGLAKLGQMPLNLVYLLIAKDKASLAGQIAEEYEQLLDEHRGIQKVDVTTAIPYSKNEQAVLQKKIEEIISSQVRIAFHVDEDILGGLIARVDGSVIDGSVRTRLGKLKKTMTSNIRH